MNKVYFMKIRNRSLYWIFPNGFHGHLIYLVPTRVTYRFTLIVLEAIVFVKWSLRSRSLKVDGDRRRPHYGTCALFGRCEKACNSHLQREYENENKKLAITGIYTAGVKNPFEGSHEHQCPGSWERNPSLFRVFREKNNQLAEARDWKESSQSKDVA